MTAAPARPPMRKKPEPPIRTTRPSVFVAEHDLVIPATAVTLEGFREWAHSEAFPEHGRICYLNGEVYVEMSPEELETHNAVKTELTIALGVLNKRLKLGRLLSDGVLLTNPDAGLSTEADAALARWEDLESERLRLIPREGVEGQYIEVEGTPSWVLEIVSTWSVRKDTRTLCDLYYQAGIPEYWIIDARGADISFQILIRGDEGYEEATGRKGWLPSGVFGRRFRLTRRRGRINLWEYTLEVKR